MVEGRGAAQRHVEHAANHRIGGRIQLQFGPLLRPVSESATDLKVKPADAFPCGVGGEAMTKARESPSRKHVGTAAGCSSQPLSRGY